MPGRARMSAMGFSGLAQLDVAQVRHAIHLAEPGKHLRPHAVVPGQDHRGFAAWRVPPDLHARDVDVVLTQDGAESPHDPRPVLMPADQESPFRHQVDAKRVDPHSPELAVHDCTRELVAPHPNRDEARVAAMRRGPALYELDATDRVGEASLY